MRDQEPCKRNVWIFNRIIALRTPSDFFPTLNNFLHLICINKRQKSEYHCYYCITITYYCFKVEICSSIVIFTVVLIV